MVRLLACSLGVADVEERLVLRSGSTESCVLSFYLLYNSIELVAILNGYDVHYENHFGCRNGKCTNENPETGPPTDILWSEVESKYVASLLRKNPHSTSLDVTPFTLALDWDPHPVGGRAQW